MSSKPDVPAQDENVERTSSLELKTISAPFDVHLISAGSREVVRALQDAGHEAYHVGGCIRDALLGHHPKDFDVATSAAPEAIRPLFRKCRLIGRRFRLAHVYAHGELVEVATFRKDASSSTSATPGNKEARLHSTLSDTEIMALVAKFMDQPWCMAPAVLRTRLHRRRRELITRRLVR